MKKKIIKRGPGRPRKHPVSPISRTVRMDAATQFKTLVLWAKENGVTRVKMGHYEAVINNQKFKPITTKVNAQPPGEALRDEIEAAFELRIAQMSEEEKAKARHDRLATWSS